MKKDNFYLYGGSLVFALFSLALYYISIFFEGWFLSSSALAVLVICVYFNVRKLDIFISNFLYLFMVLFSAFAVIAVEVGVFLPEIRTYTFFTGASARNIFLMIFFVSIMQFSSCLFSVFFDGRVVKIRLVDRLCLQILPFFAFIFLFLYLLVIAIYGSPLLMGVDRFYFWKNIAPPWFRYVHTLIPQLAFIVSFSYCSGVLSRRLAFLWGAIAISSVIAGGEKFSGLFVILVFASLPIFVVRSKLSGGSMKFLLGFAIFIAFMIGVVSVNYIAIYGESFYERILVRIALQGQMLWALDQHAEENALPLDIIKRSLFGWGGDINDSGMPFLMYLVAPVEVVDSYLSGGATFTAPFPSNIQLFFGYYFAPIFIAVIALLVGVGAGLLISAIKARSIVFSLLILKFYWFFYIAIAMGEVRNVFDWKYIVYVVSVLAMLVLSAGKNNFRGTA